jgi:hypothetical protein
LRVGINKYLLHFFGVFMAWVRELNCHTVYATKKNKRPYNM